MHMQSGGYMASIITTKSGVYIYVWNRKTKKRVQIPRSITKHLDGQPREIIDQWVETWIAQNGPEIAKASRHSTFLSDEIRVLYAAYKDHRKSMESANDKTIWVEGRVFDRLVLAYFIGKHGLKDPKTWHQAAHGFVAWLIEKEHKTASIKRAAGVLLRFGEFLVYSKYMPYPYVVKVPKTRQPKITPLKVRITPDEVLDKSKGLPSHLELAALLAYFGSLEPSVLFALRVEDFLSGFMARNEAKTWKGFQELGLGSGLSLLCQRAVCTSNKVTNILKTESRYAVVNVWDTRAAKRIAELLKGLEGFIFPYSRSYMERLWKEQVKPKMKATPHDMRRASCLYLGRTLRIPPTLLQDHMRHAQLSTTMLYTRDPQLPELPPDRVLDLDDVD